MVALRDGKWIKVYNAMELVPHYLNAVEVLEHLQKCMFPIRLHLTWPHIAQMHVVLPIILTAPRMPFRRRGVV